MSRYQVYGSGPTIQQSSNFSNLSNQLLYVTPTEFGIANADNTFTYFHGSGFIFDSVSKTFVNGTISYIKHFTADGFPLDNIEGLSLAFPPAGVLFGNAPNWSSVFNGDDRIDARVRAANAEVNDIIDSGLGNDIVLGGRGNDQLQGGGGDDKLFGGNGNDKLLGDTNRLAAGNDRLVGSNGNDILFGNAGNDTLIGGKNIDTAIFATSFDDLVITKTKSGFTVTSRDGTDTLVGIERIATDEGTYSYNKSTKIWVQIDKNPASALLDPSKIGYLPFDIPRNEDVSAKYNTILGNDIAENITLIAVKNDLVVRAGGGDDRIDTRNLVFAERPSFRLYGEEGNDSIIDSFGDDYVSGGAGNDLFAIGRGNDIFVGGTGADTFYFSSNMTPGYIYNPAASWGKDVITDFEMGIDHLEFANSANITLQQTTDGILITATHISSVGVQTDATLLLQGVNAPNAILADFLA